jgi:hypothetical protein
MWNPRAPVPAACGSSGTAGGAPGIEAQFRIYPKLGYAVVVLANEEAAAMPVYEQINEILT